MELDAARADAFAARELRTAEVGDRVALVGRWVPLFVGHDDEHVGPRGHQALPVMRAGATNTTARRSAAITRSYSSQSSCDATGGTEHVAQQRGDLLRRYAVHLVVRTADARGSVDRDPLPPAAEHDGGAPGSPQVDELARVTACDESDGRLAGHGMVEDARIHE